MSVITWDFLKKHVDESALTEVSNNVGVRAGNFISSESILLAAGPAKLATAAETVLSTLKPIGVCDTIQVSTQKNVMQLYEIGSRVPYLIPGRPVTQFQISRVLFNGDSLLAALTAGLDLNEADYLGSVMGAPGADFPLVADIPPSSVDDTGRFYMNLSSHFFNNPFGLGMFFKDSESQWVAAFYAENCIIQNHQMAVQGQNMIVMENALVRCTTFQPIAVQ